MPGPLPQAAAAVTGTEDPVASQAADVTGGGRAKTRAPVALMQCPICGVDIVADVTFEAPAAVTVTVEQLDAADGVPTTLDAVRLTVNHHTCQGERGVIPS